MYRRSLSSCNTFLTCPTSHDLRLLPSKNVAGPYALHRIDRYGELENRVLRRSLVEYSLVLFLGQKNSKEGNL